MSTFHCSHCHTEIPARGYTCPRCGKICREKVAGASAKPKRMIVAPPAAAKKRAKAPPEPARERAGRDAERDRKAKTERSTRESEAARRAQADLWRGLSEQAEMPSPLDPAERATVAPAKFIDHPVGEVVRGAGDVLNLRPGVRVEGASLVAPERHLSPSFDLGAYKLDLTFLAQAAASTVFAPVTPRRPIGEGTFPEAFRARAGKCHGPVVRAGGPKTRVALVACTCPGMNRFLADLSGGDPESLLVVRAPGGVATDANGALPGLVAALSAYGCVEVALLTHDGCFLERMRSSEVLKLLTATGHHRDDFPGDPRASACAFERAEEALAASVDFLERRSEFSAVHVHGLHLAENGKVKVVVDGRRRFEERHAGEEVAS